LTLHQGRALARGGGIPGGHLNPYAKFLFQGVKVHESQVIKRADNPVWEAYTEFLVTDKAKAVIGVKVLDSQSLAKDPSIGHVSLALTDLIEANKKGLDWFPLTGAKSGKVRMSVLWKPVIIPGAINGANAYTPPIGVLRFWAHKAIDLKNVEGLTGGKSDPYIRILHSGIIVSRTLVINNNLNPEWEEIIYIPIHNPKESFTIEAMDYQHNGKDRSLGAFDLWEVVVFTHI
jgi:Ca2+-dependent lipid-binding protein